MFTALEREVSLVIYIFARFYFEELTIYEICVVCAEALSSIMLLYILRTNKRSTLNKKLSATALFE